MRRACEFCQEGRKEIDYKEVERLRKYLTNRGKIQSRRSSGACAFHQRQLAKAIRRARQVALLPFIEAYYF